MKILKKMIFIALSFLIMFTGFIFFKEYYVSFTVTTYNLQPQSYTQRFDLKALLIYEEVHVDSPVEGSVRLNSRSGQRVSVKEPIIKIIGQNSKEYLLPAPISGLVSFRNHKTQDETTTFLNLSEQEREDKEEVYSINEGDKVEEGSFLFTVIDNHSPLKIAVYLVREDYEYLMRNFSGSFRMEIEDQNLTAEMVSDDKLEEGFVVIFKLNRAPDSLYLKNRIIDAAIIIKREEIFRVPTRALITEKGGYYIYLLKNDSFKLQKVELIKVEDRHALIADIPEGRVLINPHFAELGEEIPFL